MRGSVQTWPHPTIFCVCTIQYKGTNCSWSMQRMQRKNKIGTKLLPACAQFDNQNAIIQGGKLFYTIFIRFFCTCSMIVYWLALLHHSKKVPDQIPRLSGLLGEVCMFSPVFVCFSSSFILQCGSNTMWEQHNAKNQCANYCVFCIFTIFFCIVLLPHY